MPTRRSRSRRQEERVAANFGGRVTPGSGNGWAVKNDVKTQDLSFEVKYTDKKSYSVKKADLDKAERQALLDGGREFAFLIGFGELKGANMIIDREYVLVSREYFESLRTTNGHSE